MKHGKHYQRSKFIALAIVILGVFHLFSCSSEYSLFRNQRKLSRILKNHPELAKVEIRDSIVIVESKEIDTFFSFQTTRDTIQYAGISVIRYRDSFRFIGRTQPCTTIIRQSKTIIGDTSRKPSRAELRNQRKENKVKETAQRKDSRNKGRLILNISLLLNLYFLISLILWYFKKRFNA